MSLEMEDVFEAASCAQSLAAYLDSMEAERNALGRQVQALTNSEFEAGLRALQQAGRSETEAPTLLREARSRFNKALSLESGLRLAHTHFALATCHSNLGDAENAWLALQETLEVSIPPLVEEEHYLKGIGIGGGMGAVLLGPLGWLGTGAAILGVTVYRAHQSVTREALHAEQSQELESLKEAVRRYLKLPSPSAGQAKYTLEDLSGMTDAELAELDLTRQQVVEAVSQAEAAIAQARQSNLKAFLSGWQGLW